MRNDDPQSRSGMTLSLCSLMFMGEQIDTGIAASPPAVTTVGCLGQYQKAIGFRVFPVLNSVYCPHESIRLRLVLL